MEEQKKKSKIIAEHVWIKYTETIVCAVILAVVLFPFLILGFVYNILSIIIIFALIIVLVSVLVVIELLNIKANHMLPRNCILFKDNVFTIVGEDKIKIHKKNIVDIDFKTKKVLIFSPNFVTQTDYNYGKFYIYYNENGEQYKLMLKQVLNPDKVFEKIYSILDWDKTDEE